MILAAWCMLALFVLGMLSINPFLGLLALMFIIAIWRPSWR